MALNKYMHAALKALSYMEADPKTSYKLLRQVERATKKPRIKLRIRHGTIAYAMATMMFRQGYLLLNLKEDRVLTV